MPPLDGATLDALWDFNDPAGSHTRLERARDAASGTMRAELTTQIARALGLQQRFAEGHALLEAIADDHPIVRQRIALERGRLFNSAGYPDRAQSHFADARQIDADPFLTVDALHMLAIVDASHAEEWTAEGLNLASASKDPRVRRWEGSLLNNLGWTYADRDDLARALTTLKQAETWFAAHGTGHQIHIAQWSVAHILRRLGRTDEASIILERLRTNDPPDRFVDEELALLS